MKTLVIAVLVGSWMGMCASVGQSAESAGLPAGEGMSARYPNDMGLSRDPAVLLAEDFETGVIGDLKQLWSDVSNKDGKVLAFSDDVPAGHGKRSIQMTSTLGENTGGHLYTRLPRAVDKVFARFYVKFPEDCGYVHHFVHLGGYNPPTADAEDFAPGPHESRRRVWQGDVEEGALSVRVPVPPTPPSAVLP